MKNEVLSKKNKIIWLVLFCCIVSCGEKKKEPSVTEKKKILPEVMALDQLKQTDFLLTPRHPISANRNGIYSSVMLYAWNEVKKKLNGQVKIDSSNFDLYALNESPYYLHSIDPKEINIQTEVVENGINIKVKHNKSLPFSKSLIRYDDPMDFMGTKVAAFGLANNESLMNEMAEILYYKDDHHFALTLFPRDTAFEIMLYKPSRTDFKFLKDVILDLNEKIEVGNKALEKDPADWHYTFLSRDLMAIPVIDFNLETHYKTLEGHKVPTDKMPYEIMKAYERIGFVLNEKGAEIEAEGEMEAVAAEEEVSEEEKIVPKNFVFDGPFLLLVTWHHERPFLAAWITNADLMEKQIKKNL